MYIQATIHCKDSQEETADIVTALLSDFPFHTFSHEANLVLAYGEAADFDEDIKIEIKESISGFSTSVQFEMVEKQNWNEEWEKNYFKPIWIKDKVCVFAPFHTLDKEPEIPIIIEPKMSFGTGHHATTQLVCEAILHHAADMQGARILDMGAGTGILAILADKMGASFGHAIDIEEWCAQNAEENFKRNNVSHFQSDMGDAALLKDIKEPFNHIFANIQRNILLQDMAAYTRVLAPGGLLFISGFPPSDAAKLIDHAGTLGLQHLASHELNDWCAISFKLS
jgi:ribosomal protein L11 methyltransferase